MWENSPYLIQYTLWIISKFFNAWALKVNSFVYAPWTQKWTQPSERRKNCFDNYACKGLIQQKRKAEKYDETHLVLLHVIRSCRTGMTGVEKKRKK